MVSSVLLRLGVVPTTIPVTAIAPVHVAAVVESTSPVSVSYVGTAFSKTVHYSGTPVVTDYSSTLHKLDLNAFDTPSKFNNYPRLISRLMQVESTGRSFVAADVRKINIRRVKRNSAYNSNTSTTKKIYPIIV